MELIKPSSVQEVPLVVGDLYLDPAGHIVSIAGQVVDLTPREFDLLHTFVLNPGRVISNEELLSTVWGAEFAGQPQVVYVHVRWLRKKIETDPNNPRSHHHRSWGRL